jgi:hypothetical protein
LARVENRLELFRGQIEELQGKMQQALAELEGRRGYLTMIRGRGLEARGRARQAYAYARMGASDISESLRQQPSAYAPYAGLIGLGVAITFVALFAPGVFTQAWELLRGQSARTTSGSAPGFEPRGPSTFGTTVPMP